MRDGTLPRWKSIRDSVRDLILMIRSKKHPSTGNERPMVELIRFDVHEPNRILAELTFSQRSCLDRYGEDVELHVGTTLVEARQRIEHIYFLRTGLVSLLVVLPNSRIADAGFIDPEGAAGSIYDPAEPVSFTRAAVSANGRALRLPRESFEEFKSEFRELREATERCNHRITIRSQQTAACNLMHRLEQRLCRWLLQISGKTSDRNIVVTQDHLAQVLGVTRARLNEALSSLSALDAIDHVQRGMFRITDIRPIVKLACGCYEAMRLPSACVPKVT